VSLPTGIPTRRQSQLGLQRALSTVVLECHLPNGTVAPIFEFPVVYSTTTGEGDRQFTADRAALARYLAKLQSVPAGTFHRMFCSFKLVVGFRTASPVPRLGLARGHRHRLIVDLFWISKALVNGAVRLSCPRSSFPGIHVGWARIQASN
jgi:hypothetical protein